MKKKLIWIIIASVLVTAIAAGVTVLIIHLQNKPFKNKVADSLPKYESAVIYSDSATDGDRVIEYGKYSYKDVSEDTLKINEYLKKIDLSVLDAGSIDSLILSVERFDLMLGKLYSNDADSVADVTENFDTDIDINSLGAPNYFYVETITGGKADPSPLPETCDELYIYYFEVESQILYYFYANQKEINKTVAD